MTTFKEAIGTAAGLQADPNGNFINGQVNVVTVQFDQPKVKKRKSQKKVVLTGGYSVELQVDC